MLVPSVVAYFFTEETRTDAYFYLFHCLILNHCDCIINKASPENIATCKEYRDTANFSIKTANQWSLVVIPGLTRNPERIENHGFPITNFGNDKKYAVVLGMNIFDISNHQGKRKFYNRKHAVRHGY